MARKRNNGAVDSDDVAGFAAAFGVAKGKQKVSGCFRTPRYAATYCRISSYLQSMAQRGYNPLAAIEIALNGNAATMVEQPPRDNPANQDKGGE